jgi:hypothetical protein
MSWKVHTQFTQRVQENTSELRIPVVGMAEKTMRVTVEEEVSECCTLWRGKDVRVQLSYDGRWLPPPQPGPFKFCPECGRRL